MIKRIGQRLARRRYIRQAILDQADLSAFRARPRPRVYVGLFLMALSYLIGWPMVGLLAVLSAVWVMPMLVAIGGPVTYGLSHVMFLVGLYMAGKEYTAAFMRFAARKLVLRMTGGDPFPASREGQP